MLDNEQVKCTLTDDKEVLDALRRKKTLLPDKHNGGELYELQFDSVPIGFRLLKTGEKTIVPCSGRVARALRRDSRTLIGDPLTGDHRPAIVSVGSYKLSEGDPSLRLSATTCPFCRLETGDARKLAFHLMQECRHPDAQVPQFQRERAAKEKAAQAQEDERVSGPSQETINQRLAVRPGTVREALEPIAPPPARTDDPTLDEVEVEVEEGVGG
jgi:hypothetical protein